MGTRETKAFSLNVNAELYQDQYGELAIRLPDERVYRNVGKDTGARFQTEVVEFLEKGARPGDWLEMSPREIQSGKGWRCIATLGFRDGDPGRPAIAFEVDLAELGDQARRYLADALP